MRTFSKVLFVALIGSLFLSSCVSSKKYKDLMADKDSMQAKYEKKISDLNDLLKEGEEKNAQLSQKIDNLKGDLSEADKAKMELKNLADMKDKELQKIKGEITAAFAGINNSDIKIEQKFDKLYVSMPNQVLYKSGKADMSKAGKEVVAELAEVFKSNPAMSIIVEGHTDKEPVKRSRYLYKDNWALSAARSVGVIRELVEMGVPSSQLTLSGKADTNAMGEVKDEMAKDRRIEFVVTPNVQKLYSISQMK